MAVQKMKKSGVTSALAAFASKGSSLDKLKELKDKGDRVGGGASFFRVPTGTTDVRILPAIDEDEAFYHATAYYYINGKYVYDRRYQDETAFSHIGAYASKLWKQYKDGGEKDERLAKEAKSLFPKQQFLFNVLVRSDDGDRVVVMQTGKGVKDNITELCLDDSYGDVSNAVTGRDLGIKRMGKGLGTTYQVMPRDISLLAGDDDDDYEAAELIQEVLDQRKNLAELIKYPTEEEEKAELARYLSDFEDSDEESESEVEDDEDDEDEVTDDDENTLDEIEAQLEAAKRKRRGK